MTDSLQGLDEFIRSMKAQEKAKNASNPPDTEEPLLPVRKMAFQPGFNFTSWPEREEDFRQDLIGFIEQFFYDHEKLPNRADFELRFQKTDLPSSPVGWQKLLESLFDPLEARGLPTYNIDVEWLDPLFVTAVSLVVNFHDKRQLAAKLKEVGSSVKKWNAWMRIQKYREYFEDRLNTVIDQDTENIAKMSLNQMIASNDLQAIKYYYELRNIYRPQQNQNVQIMMVLQAIMEILAKYVEKDVINKIASEFRSTSIIAGELSA